MIKFEEIVKIMGMNIEKLTEEEKNVINLLLDSYNEKLENLETYIYSQENDESRVELAVKKMASIIEDTD